MARLHVDGNEHTGRYRVVCDCGDSWSGQVHPNDLVGFEPALPVAETVVHMKLAHNGGLPDLVFTNRFKLWLEAYWARTSNSGFRDQVERRQRAIAAARADPTWP